MLDVVIFGAHLKVYGFIKMDWALEKSGMILAVSC